MNTVRVPIAKIECKENVRQQISEDTLERLISSVGQVGILQPILVQQRGDSYCLVAGKRRLEACKAAGLAEVPAVIVDNSIDIMQIQLVENLQREDLNPLERATAIDRYMQSRKLSKAAAASELGIPRTTLTEWLSILDIDPKYHNALVNNYYGGNSPLTTSHVLLAKRFAEKLGSDQMLSTALDAVIYYGLTRAETKKVLDLTANADDLSIAAAVRKVRLIPAEKGERQAAEAWDVDKVVSSLARSGNFLVKCKPADIAELNEDEKKELLRQSRALSRLLKDVMHMVSTKGKGQSRIS